MKRYRRSRLLIVVAVCLSLAALLAYVEVVPTRSRIEHAQVQVQALEQELSTEQAFLLRANNTGDRDSTLQAERRATFLEFASTDSLEVFVDQLGHEMAALGFTHAHVAPVIEELLSASTVNLENVRLRPLRFAIEAQAGFLEIGRFIELLEDQRYFSRISNVSISHNDGTSPDVLCQIQFLAYLRGAE